MSTNDIVPSAEIYSASIRMVGAGDLVGNGVVDASAISHPEPHSPTRRYAAEDGKADPRDFKRPNH